MRALAALLAAALALAPAAAAAGLAECPKKLADSIEKERTRVSEDIKAAAARSRAEQRIATREVRHLLGGTGVRTTLDLIEDPKKRARAEEGSLLAFARRAQALQGKVPPKKWRKLVGLWVDALLAMAETPEPVCGPVEATVGLATDVPLAIAGAWVLVVTPVFVPLTVGSEGGRTLLATALAVGAIGTLMLAADVVTLVPTSLLAPIQAGRARRHHERAAKSLGKFARAVLEFERVAALR